AVAIVIIMIGNDVDYAGLTNKAMELTRLDFIESEVLIDLVALLLSAPFAAAMYFGARRLAHTLVVNTLSHEQTHDATTGALTGPALALISILHATLLLVVVVPLLA